MRHIFKYIKADKFFPDYAPAVKNYKRKISDRHPTQFTEAERADIKNGIEKMFIHLRNKYAGNNNKHA